MRGKSGESVALGKRTDKLLQLPPLVLQVGPAKGSEFLGINPHNENQRLGID